MLGGFVDSLLQMFENCRPGLTDEILRAGPAGVERFFLDLYEKERGRLSETIQQEQHLSVDDRRELFERVDDRIRKVVVPAYVRVATRFTPRERNDFYLAPEPLHGPAWHDHRVLESERQELKDRMPAWMEQARLKLWGEFQISDSAPRLAADVRAVAECLRDGEEPSTGLPARFLLTFSRWPRSASTWTARHCRFCAGGRIARSSRCRSRNPANGTRTRSRIDRTWASCPACPPYTRRV